MTDYLTYHGILTTADAHIRNDRLTNVQFWYVDDDDEYDSYDISLDEPLDTELFDDVGALYDRLYDERHSFEQRLSEAHRLRDIRAILEEAEKHDRD